MDAVQLAVKHACEVAQPFILTNINHCPFLISSLFDTVSGPSPCGCLLTIVNTTPLVSISSNLLLGAVLISADPDVVEPRLTYPARFSSIDRANTVAETFITPDPCAIVTYLENCHIILLLCSLVHQVP